MYEQNLSQTVWISLSVTCRRGLQLHCAFLSQAEKKLGKSLLPTWLEADSALCSTSPVLPGWEEARAGSGQRGLVPAKLLFVSAGRTDPGMGGEQQQENGLLASVKNH